MSTKEFKKFRWIVFFWSILSVASIMLIMYNASDHLEKVSDPEEYFKVSVNSFDETAVLNAKKAGCVELYITSNRRMETQVTVLEVAKGRNDLNLMIKDFPDKVGRIYISKAYIYKTDYCAIGICGIIEILALILMFISTTPSTDNKKKQEA